jgi:hypothetical protein
MAGSGSGSEDSDSEDSVAASIWSVGKDAFRVTLVFGGVA